MQLSELLTLGSSFLMVHFFPCDSAQYIVMAVIQLVAYLFDNSLPMSLWVFSQAVLLSPKVVLTGLGLTLNSRAHTVGSLHRSAGSVDQHFNEVTWPSFSIYWNSARIFNLPCHLVRWLFFLHNQLSVA